MCQYTNHLPDHLTDEDRKVMRLITRDMVLITISGLIIIGILYLFR